MAAVLSLYRRHRPSTFDEVVGQEHIVRTLRNAIELGKVHHAYLFVGSRGTGKTSMAKLLACALNAEGGPTARTSRPTTRPAWRSAGAPRSTWSRWTPPRTTRSTTSASCARTWRSRRWAAARRVYILDEAHMLSNAAWNAFLKTLEEPPSHVVFVLATTEAHKVPATIVDRCHRFDFHRPTLEQIAGVLRRVAEQEEIEAPDAAIGLIARHATGSFRDALGTLEQLVTYGGPKIELDDRARDHGRGRRRARARHRRGARSTTTRRASCSRSRSCRRRGATSPTSCSDLSEHLRHLFVVQTLGEVPATFAVTAEHTDRLNAQADRLPQAEVLRAIDLLARARSAVKDGSEPRIQLELALLKAVQPQSDLSIQALLFRIEQLERKLEGATGRSAAPARGAGERRRRHSPPPAPRAAARRQPRRRRLPLPRRRPRTSSTSSSCAACGRRCSTRCARENAMVAALLGEARAERDQRRPAHGQLPRGRGVLAQEGRRESRAAPDGAARPDRPRRSAITFDLSAPPPGEGEPRPVMSEDELLERLKAEFKAEEVFDDDEGS